MKRSTALAASALLAAAIFTQAQSPAPRVQKSLLVLTQAQIDPSRLLAPPPKDGSEQQLKEMAEVKRITLSTLWREPLEAPR